MRQRSLVAFTVLGQTAAGLLAALAVVRWGVGPEADPWLMPPVMAAGVLLAGAGAAAVPHLGTPRNAWRSLSGLGSSWLSREILAFGAVGAGWVVLAALLAGGGGAGLRGAALLAAALAGLALVYAMARVYRLRTVPPWDSALTSASFFLTALVTGTLAAGMTLGVAGQGMAWVASLRLLALAAAWGLGAELLLAPMLRRQARRARMAVDEGLWAEPDGNGWGSSAWLTALRVTSLLASLAASAMAAVGAGSIGMAPVPPLLGLALAAALPAELMARAGFYRRFARTGV